jgi:hypothetical protein
MHCQRTTAEAIVKHLGAVTATREIDDSAITATCYYIAARPLSAAELNRLALNIIKPYQDKRSNGHKFKRAGWDDRFLVKIFSETA